MNLDITTCLLIGSLPHGSVIGESAIISLVHKKVMHSVFVWSDRHVAKRQKKHIRIHFQQLLCIK